MVLRPPHLLTNACMVDARGFGCRVQDKRLVFRVRGFGFKVSEFSVSRPNRPYYQHSVLGVLVGSGERVGNGRTECARSCFRVKGLGVLS